MNEQGYIFNKAEADAFGKETRAYKMLLKLVDVIKTEAAHVGRGEHMAPEDLLNKIVGMAHEYQLPEIREKALEGN